MSYIRHVLGGVTYPYMNMWNRHIHTGTQNVHNVHNVHIDNIGIPKHKKHSRLLSSGTKLFITFELKGFSTWGGKYTIFLCWLFHLPQTTCGTRRKASASSESQPSSSDAKTQPTDFSQISAHASSAWRHSHPWSHSYLGFLFWHLWMTHPSGARVNTCAHVAPN